MAKKEVRKYNCPDSVMLDAGDTLHVLYVEDEAEFQAYNIVMFPLSYKTDFLAKITAARSVIKDMVVVDEQQEETEEVTAKMKECMAYFQKMKPTIVFAFPDKQAVWDQFGFDDYDFASRSQGRMVQFMEMLVETTDKYKTTLLAQGFTQPKIDEGIALAGEIRQEQLEQEQAKKNRPLETQERIVILNTCWDAMVFVTSAAKAVFYDNYAKLHQYTLPEGGSDEQHTFTGTVAPDETANAVERTFNADDEVEIEAQDTDLEFGMVLLVDDVVAAGSGVTVPAGTSQTVTASQLGDVTQNHFLNVTNNSGVEGSYKVVV
jgi:hypothetical protein